MTITFGMNQLILQVLLLARMKILVNVVELGCVRSMAGAILVNQHLNVLQLSLLVLQELIKVVPHVIRVLIIVSPAQDHHHVHNVILPIL